MLQGAVDGVPKGRYCGPGEVEPARIRRATFARPMRLGPSDTGHAGGPGRPEVIDIITSVYEVLVLYRLHESGVSDAMASKAGRRGKAIFDAASNGGNTNDEFCDEGCFAPSRLFKDGSLPRPLVTGSAQAAQAAHALHGVPCNGKGGFRAKLRDILFENMRLGRQHSPFICLCSFAQQSTYTQWVSKQTKCAGSKKDGVWPVDSCGMKK